MKLPTDKDFAYEMMPLKLVSWPLGTWPLQEYNLATGLKSVVTIVLLVVLLSILYAETYLYHEDPEKNLDAVLIAASGIMAIFKIATFRLRPAGLIANFASAVRDYQLLEGEENRAIVKWHAYLTRIFFSYFGITTAMMVPLFAGEEGGAESFNETRSIRQSYPMPSDNVMEILQVSGNMYTVVSIWEHVVLVLLTIGNYGSDTLFCGILFHLCGQVEILKLEFSRFLDHQEGGAERFNALIRRHHHLLTLAERLNDTIGSILMLQLFFSCMLICITGFQLILSLQELNFVMLLKTFVVVNTLLTQMFAYSYVGEYSKNQFGSIGHLAYCSDWSNAPCKLSRNIVFVLLKSQSPVHLKAGSFFTINLQTYMSILKTSMSYLSVLRVMVT